MDKRNKTALAYLLIGVAAVAVIGTVVLLLVRRKKQARQTDNT